MPDGSVLAIDITVVGTCYCRCQCIENGWFQIHSSRPFCYLWNHRKSVFGKRSSLRLFLLWSRKVMNVGLSCPRSRSGSSLIVRQSYGGFEILSVESWTCKSARQAEWELRIQACQKVRGSILDKNLGRTCTIYTLVYVTESGRRGERITNFITFEGHLTFAKLKRLVVFLLPL